MNYQEANKELMKQRAVVLNKECSVNHFKPCRYECQSFFEGNFTQVDQNDYSIKNSPCCNNAFVTGIITHEE